MSNDNIEYKDLNITNDNFIELINNGFIKLKNDILRINNENYIFKNYLNPYPYINNLIISYDSQYIKKIIIKQQPFTYINTLIINNLKHLKELYVRELDLKRIKIIGKSNLKILDCSHNNLKKLNINNLIKLKSLNCSYNKINKLKRINKLINLIRIDCSNNKIFKLNINNLKKLEEIYCDDNKLLEFNINQSNNLISISCRNNQLQILNIINLINLKILDCEKNNINIIIKPNNNINVIKDNKTISISQKEYEEYLKIKDIFL